MNITITVDDRTPAGRRILDEARRARKGVHVHNPAEGGCPPPGYMTSEEAYERLSRSFDDICRKYGVL